MPSAKFQEVYEKVSAMGTKLKDAGKSGPSQDEQLQLYAYAKIAEGKDIKEAKKPGMFELTAKAKYKKWEEVVNSGVTQEQAEEKYIALGEELLAKHDS